jgi:hypothetical protein
MRAKRKLRNGDNRAAIPVHDRRARDFALHLELMEDEVLDPMGLEADDKIKVMRQLKGDPLARLYAHHQVDQIQFFAGQRYQRDWRTAEQGAKAIDPTKEAVDGGAPIDPLPERRLAARARLEAAETAVKHQKGMEGLKLIRAFLIDQENIERLALSTFSRSGERWSNYYGRSLRDTLDVLAVEYGLSSACRR